MSSNAGIGYIRIPDSQLRLERIQKTINKTWHQNIMNLLLGKDVCGSCLRLEDDLVDWDAEFVLWRHEYDMESSLKTIMMTTFGPSVISIIPNKNFCQKCVDVILSAYLFILELKNNCKHIQRKLTEISQQMKWSDHLDETGCLTESVNNKIKPDDKLNTTCTNLSQAKKQNETVTRLDNLKDSVDSMANNVKTHKIMLNNESLKTILLQEPNMHKFLNMKEQSSKKFTEHKLPEGITVKKITKSMDMSDFAPHDLLELNWAEDENDPVKTNTEIPNNKLHSNEALIMNLMEKAKTVEKHIYFHDNLKLQVNKSAQIPLVEQNFNNALSVKLVQTSNANEICSDNDEIVPQDLLEINWPEEQGSGTVQHTRIPVKKLNFNEALTVKYIPSHTLPEQQESIDDMAPHELLELNWNEDTDEQNSTTLPQQTNQKHSIDLTQWLQDQGMSTIKTKIVNENEDNLNVPETNEQIQSGLKNKETSENRNEISGTAHSTSKIDSAKESHNSKVPQNSMKQDNIIRCAFCDLTFIQFESYMTHYRNHNPTDAAKCYRCRAEFSVIELLVEHLLMIHSDNLVYCTLCYVLLTQDNLAKHMTDSHRMKVEIINADSVKRRQVADSRCKRCNKSVTNLPDSPHTCVFSFDCTECKNDCVHEKYLKSYVEQIKANFTVFKCPDCEYQYKTKQGIIRHADYVHLMNKPRQCRICHAIFSLQADLTNHSDVCHFRCRGCRKVFEDKKDLDVHNCSKIFTKDLKCEFCGEKFMALKCYLQHKQTALVVGEKCQLCQDSVTNRCNMSRHMQNIHHLSLKQDDNVMLYECTICLTDFQNESDFTQHICLYECRICCKRFSVKALYERHLHTHFDVAESLKCSVCNLQLIDKYALANHMSTHRDHEKCHICFQYIEKNILKQHIESHNDSEGRLKCPHCALVCDNKNLFELHVNRFHLLSRPYQCDLCQRSFYSKHKMREHIRLNSCEIKPEKCNVCSKKFARKATLQKHMLLHNTGQLYNCDLCDKRYITVDLLNEHKKSHSIITFPMP